MTKEELKQEAEEYAYEKWTDYPEKQEIAEQAYIDGAEPREKQIQIDTENIIALQKQNGELTDKVKELEVKKGKVVEHFEAYGQCRDSRRIAELEETINKLREQFALRYDLEDKIKELEQQIEREKNLNQCMTDNNEQLRELIEKMKCCSNCKFGYKCSLFSTQIHNENGVEYQTQAKWNKEKEKYCNVGYSGKYECWEIKEK